MNLPHMAQLSREPPAEVPAPGDSDHQPTNHQLGGAMTYTARYTALIAQRAYTRRVTRDGISALLAPYTVRPAPVIPPQRRRSVQRERIGA